MWRAEGKQVPPLGYNRLKLKATWITPISEIPLSVLCSPMFRSLLTFLQYLLGEILFQEWHRTSQTNVLYSEISTCKNGLQSQTGLSP